jgi:hypothetical protein
MSSNGVSPGVGYQLQTSHRMDSRQGRQNEGQGLVLVRFNEAPGSRCS